MVCAHQFCAKPVVDQINLVIPFKNQPGISINIPLGFGFCEKHLNDAQVERLVSLQTYRTIISSFHEANIGDPDIANIRVEIFGEAA